MIRYKIPIFGCRGSVFPYSFWPALLSGLAGAALKFIEQHHVWFGPWLEKTFHINTAAFTGIMSVIGFLVIFRTSHAYGRFKEGADLLAKMRGGLFDTVSTIIAFSNVSTKDPLEVREFQHMLIRLVSLFHGICMAKLQGEEVTDLRAGKLKIIDCSGWEPLSLDKLADRETSQVEMTYHHIQALITKAIKKDYVNMPPPIAGRIFMSLSQAFVSFTDCRGVALIPFPFPYAQTTIVLLIMHAILTPFVMCTWTDSKGMMFIFVFVWVFMLWSLRGISVQLENPFGMFANDLPIIEYQNKINERLRLLVDTDALEIPKFRNGYDYDATHNCEQMLTDLVSTEHLCENEVEDVVDSDVSDDESGHRPGTTDRASYTALEKR